MAMKEDDPVYREQVCFTYYGEPKNYTYFLFIYKNLKEC